MLLGGDVLRRSSDRGASWSPVSGPTFVYALAQGADGTLYASGYDGAVHASFDHGATFTPLGAPWCTGAVASRRCHRSDPTRLLAACASANPALDGVHRWTGANWQKSASPNAPGAEQAWSVTIDPFDPEPTGRPLHARCRHRFPRTTRLRYYGAHVYVSHDGGAQWTDVTSPASCAIAHTVLFLSDTPSHLVVGTRTADATCPGVLGRLWESFDAGSELARRDHQLGGAAVVRVDREDPLGRGGCSCRAGTTGSPAGILPPAEVSLLALTSATRLDWIAVPGASDYDVARAPLSTLRASGLGAFRHVACGLDSPPWDDAERPPAGDGFAYLVRATRRGDDGSWGIAALNPLLAACPAAIPSSSLRPW